MAESISKEILDKTFKAFLKYVEGFVGENKAWEFAQHSRDEAEKYYKHLSLIQLGEKKNLVFLNTTLSDKEILGFSLWMSKLISELKEFMVGVGRVDPEKILGNLKKSLQPTGFLEFFQQAKELSL